MSSLESVSHLLVSFDQCSCLPFIMKKTRVQIDVYDKGKQKVKKLGTKNDSKQKSLMEMEGITLGISITTIVSIQQKSE